MINEKEEQLKECKEQTFIISRERVEAYIYGHWICYYIY